MGGAIKFDPLGDIKKAFTPDIPDAPAASTSTTINSTSAGGLGSIDAVAGTSAGADEEDNKRKGVSKKKMGSKGTQIPLQASKAPTTGVQI